MQTEIHISRRAADRLRAGHLWVYRSELLDATPELLPGALVTVTDASGKPLGSALWSSSSQIALRLVTRAAGLTREQYLIDLRVLVLRALERRDVIAPLLGEPHALSNAQRLVFSEADELPGIVIDRYADLLVVQLLTQGTAQDDVRQSLVEILRARFAPHHENLTLWERPDPRIRELEQLPPAPELPLYSRTTRDNPQAQAPSNTTFTLNGLRFGFDAAAGQKTGAFLDQRLNYAAAAEWVRRSGLTSHALDVCTYHGGFALHLAQACTRVTGVDKSHAALEAADRNLVLNPDLRARVDWIQADAFEFLRALDDINRPAEAGSALKRMSSARPLGLPERFDAIVLDPPAFAKSRRATEGALRGYKELNLRAIRLLAAGGTLITCSCSQHVSLEVFTSIVSEAAADAGRRVQLLETRAAAPDHPEVLALPETRYLKCLVCRVE